MSGFNGFIGKNIINSGLFKNDIILPLDLRYLSNVTTKTLEEYMSNHQYVDSYIIHLASPTDKKTIHDGNFLDVSISLSNTMIEISKLLKPIKFIYMSSGKVNWTVKDKTGHDINPLGNVKLETENFLLENINKETQVQIIRLYNAFGPNQKKEYFIPKIIYHIKKNKPITLGTLSHKRDYIFIEDVVSAVNVLINSTTNESIFELGSGKSTEMKKILNLILKNSKQSIEVFIDEKLERNFELHKERADINKLVDLGWFPGYELEKGIVKTLQHYK